MSSTHTECDDNILLLEHGESLSDDSVRLPLFSGQAVKPSFSQISTLGLNSAMASITLSSQTLPPFTLSQVVLYCESEAVVPAGRVSFKEIDIRTERDCPSHSMNLPVLCLCQLRKLIGSNILDHAVDTLSGIRHPSLIGSRT